MKLAIMQPYFMPYIGYWQMMDAVDKFIIFDDVNYIKKGWINRNYLLVNNKSTLFTISIRSASQNKLINELEIIDDFSTICKTIQSAYRKAPYFDEIYDFLQNSIFSFPDRNLSRFIGNSLRLTAKYLGINVDFDYSSNLSNCKHLKGSDKILDICKLQDASTYINAIGGKGLYNKSTFFKNGISLYFINSHEIMYRQINKEFVPHLSIIDVLMFNGKNSCKFLKEYSLE